MSKLLNSKNRLFIVTFAVTFLVYTSLVAYGDTTWTNSTIGNWNIAGNWDNGVPDRNIAGQENAVIDPNTASDFTVTYNSGNNIDQLTVANQGSGKATLNIDASLVTYDNRTLKNGCQINVNSGGSLAWGSGVVNKSIQIKEGSTLNINGGTVDNKDNFTYVGGFNGDGYMMITNGGVFKTRKYMSIGYGKNGNSWAAKTEMYVLDGGYFEYISTWDRLEIGENMIASLMVSNATVYVNISNGRLLYVGDARANGVRGIGTVDVYNGGSVTNMGGLVLGTGDQWSTKNGTGTLNIDGGTWEQYADVAMGVTNYDTGTINVSTNGLFLCDSTVTVGIDGKGQINVSGGELIVTNSTGTGTILISSASGTGTVTVTGGMLRTDKLYATNGVKSVMNILGGTLAITAGVISNNTTLAIGNGTNATTLALWGQDTLTVQGDVTFKNNAMLSSEVIGTGNGDFNVLDIHGTLTFDNNSLITVNTNNYTPARGDEWRIALADTVNGLPEASSGFTIRITDEGSRRAVVVEFPPLGTVVMIR